MKSSWFIGISKEHIEFCKELIRDSPCEYVVKNRTNIACYNCPFHAKNNAMTKGQNCLSAGYSSSYFVKNELLIQSCLDFIAMAEKELNRVACFTNNTPMDFKVGVRISKRIPIDNDISLSKLINELSKKVVSEILSTINSIPLIDLEAIVKDSMSLTRINDKEIRVKIESFNILDIGNSFNQKTDAKWSKK